MNHWLECHPRLHASENIETGQKIKSFRFEIAIGSSLIFVQVQATGHYLLQGLPC